MGSPTIVARLVFGPLTHKVVIPRLDMYLDFATPRGRLDFFPGNAKDGYSEWVNLRFRCSGDICRTKEQWLVEYKLDCISLEGSYNG